MLRNFGLQKIARSKFFFNKNLPKRIFIKLIKTVIGSKEKATKKVRSL